MTKTASQKARLTKQNSVIDYDKLALSIVKAQQLLLQQAMPVATPKKSTPKKAVAVKKSVEVKQEVKQATPVKANNKNKNNKKDFVRVSKSDKIDTTKKVDYLQLLNEAMTGNGKLLEAYKAFHKFSFVNTLLAMVQLEEIAPIKTYNQWLEVGRKVKQGQKAISLWRPIQSKSKVNEETGEEIQGRTFFKFQNSWFGYYQTEAIQGQNDLSNNEELTEYSKELALEALKINMLKFKSINGNAQGYACKEGIAINPMAQLKMKTFFHELAHVVLGHLEENESSLLIDNKELSRNIKEVEAEATAMLCIESLGLEGLEYCRGYIQAWNTDNTINEESAQRIIQATSKILKAGYPQIEYKKKEERS